MHIYIYIYICIHAFVSLSVVMMTTFRGNLEIVHLLLLAKADANKADADDCTPICKAASTGNTDVVRYLMKAGMRNFQRSRDYCACQL